jgi:hypothetical protein
MTLEHWTQLGEVTTEKSKDTQCCSNHRP